MESSPRLRCISLCMGSPPLSCSTSIPVTPSNRLSALCVFSASRFRTLEDSFVSLPSINVCAMARSSRIGHLDHTRQEEQPCIREMR